MGCVFISIVQFSRIKSALSAAKTILSNLHFLVKYFFKNFSSLFCFLLSQQRITFYQMSFRLSSTFLIFFNLFRAFFWYFASAEVIISVPIILVNVFLLKHFSFYRLLWFDFLSLSRFLASTFKYYTPLFQNVNTFFQLFSIFWKSFKNCLKKAKNSKNRREKSFSI